MNGSRYCWCGIYTRQSRDTNSEYSSCAAQLDACLAIVKSRFGDGWVDNGRRYEDEAESSETLERPGLQRLLAHIREGKVDRVVIHRLDRLSRRLVDCIGFLQELRDRQIPLTIVTQPELAETAGHTFLLNLMAAFAEFEQAMTRERLADARAALKRRGRRVAGVVPYGYRRDPDNKQLVLVPSEAKRVVTMFELAAQGVTPREIAEIVNGRRWRTRRGGRWTPRQMLETLTNPVYVGRIRDGDDTLPGIHQAIVSDDPFREVRSRIDSRRTRKRARDPRSTDWPLQGVLFCGRCGRVMSPSSSHHGNVIYRYYRCRSHAGGQPPCTGVSAPAHQLENLVVRMIADPRAWEEHGDLSSELRQSAQGVAEAFQLLTERGRRNVMTQLVARVTFDPDASSIQVSFDEAVLEQLIAE